MRHTTCFHTRQPFIYHLCTALKPIFCILCHITSYTTPQPLSISIKLHQRIAFRYSFKINIVGMRHTTCFDTPQPLIYHRCTALKPILCILCHITSYTTPSTSFNFDQTSSGFNCWFSFAPVFQWCCSTPEGSPGVGRNMLFLSSPHLCFIIVFICDLFVSRDDPLMG